MIEQLALWIDSRQGFGFIFCCVVILTFSAILYDIEEQERRKARLRINSAKLPLTQLTHSGKIKP